MVFGQDTERKRQERAMREAGRLPPGQSLTLKWPVLHEGTVPRIRSQHMGFSRDGIGRAAAAPHAGTNSRACP